MRAPWLMVLIVCGACGGATPPPPAFQPPAPAPAPYVAPAPLPPAMLDDATVIAQSKAFYASLDGDDVAGLESMAGPSFTVFDQGRFYNVAHLTERMRARIERGAPKRTRSWTDERAFVGPNTAVFVASALERVAGEGDQPPAEWEGWNTLVWVFDGTQWRVAHAQWQSGGIDAERTMWNEAYRKSVGFKLSANELLIETVKGKRAGTALDVAMGQGRNAVYLAKKGWRVTGVDLSDEGIRLAKQAAARARVRIDGVQADLASYDFGTSKWDLVTLIYAGDDLAMIDKIKLGLRKRGLFVVEYFLDESTDGTGIGGFAPGELARAFDGWKIIRDDVVEDIADWGLRKAKLVRFVAQKP